MNFELQLLETAEKALALLCAPIKKVLSSTVWVAKLSEKGHALKCCFATTGLAFYLFNISTSTQRQSLSEVLCSLINVSFILYTMPSELVVDCNQGQTNTLAVRLLQYIYASIAVWKCLAYICDNLETCHPHYIFN